MAPLLVNTDNEKSLMSVALDSGFLESLKKNSREGEEGLMLAVLENAIEFFQMYVLAEDKRGKKLFQEAEEWLLEKNGDWVFSFENICEVLALDPDYIRQGLLRWKEAKRKGPPEAKIYSLPARKKTKKSASVEAKTAFRALASSRVAFASLTVGACSSAGQAIWSALARCSA
jgi:hypothetical protein